MLGQLKSKQQSEATHACKALWLVHVNMRSIAAHYHLAGKHEGLCFRYHFLYLETLAEAIAWLASRLNASNMNATSRTQSSGVTVIAFKDNDCTVVGNACACAGSPKVLELFRSNRALKGGRLHWALPDCAPQSSRRVFNDCPLTVQMVGSAHCLQPAYNETEQA